MEIYINSLPYSLTNDELRDYFEEFGEVTSVKIIRHRHTGRSRGFGFVVMPNDGEAAEAMKALDHSKVAGRHVHGSRSTGKGPPTVWAKRAARPSSGVE